MCQRLATHLRPLGRHAAPAIDGRRRKTNNKRPPAVILMARSSESALSASTAFVLSQRRKSMCAASAFDASGRPFVVMAGGVNADDSVSSELIVYDVLRESKRMLTLAEPRYDCVACRVDDLVVIAGGCTNKTAPNLMCRTLKVEAFNVSSGELATVPGGLSAGRIYMAVAQTRTHCAFVGGGRVDNVNASNAVDALDVRTRTWTYLNLTESRYFPAAVGIDDTVVVMGSDIGTSAQVRFTVEEIDFSIARPLSRVARNLTSSVYENAGARAGDWVIFAGGRRRDKNGTQLKPSADVREPSGLWREIPFAAPDWMSDDAPFNLQAGSIGTQALFALGTDSFLGSTGTPYVFLFNPAEIETPSNGWTTRTWNLNISGSALATFVYNNTGYAFVAGGAYYFSVSLDAVHLLKFEGLEPTCSQCPPPSVCIGDERCLCDAMHLREGRFGCKLNPDDTAALTLMPSPLPTLLRRTTAFSTSLSGANDAPSPVNDSTTAAAIAGGVVGALVVAIVVTVLGLFVGRECLRRRRRQREESAATHLSTVSLSAPPSTIRLKFFFFVSVLLSALARMNKDRARLSEACST
jgi:hypothetical protein